MIYKQKYNNLFLEIAFLQKVSFSKFIRNNPRPFSAFQRKKIVIAVASYIFFFISLFSIDAKPIFARYYKQSYGYMPSCSSCHKDGGGSVLNAYGEAFKKAGNSVGSFAKISSLDLDGDGFSNEAESKVKANPGDKNSTPTNPGTWLDPNSLVPKDIQNLFPSIRTWLLKDAILTNNDIEESKKMGATLVLTDENTIYIPAENNLPVGTAIIFPVSYETKTFYLMMSTDKSLTIKDVKVLDSKNLAQAKKDELYQGFSGKKPKDIIIPTQKSLESTIAQAVKNAGILLYVRLKGA
jgi:hypothetical protein